MYTDKLFVLILRYQENYCSFIYVPSPLFQLPVFSQSSRFDICNDFFVELFSAQYKTLDVVECKTWFLWRRLPELKSQWSVPFSFDFCQC